MENQSQKEVGIKAVKDLLVAFESNLAAYKAKLAEADDLKLHSGITAYVVIVNDVYTAGIDEHSKPTLNMYGQSQLLTHEQASRYNNIKPFINRDKVAFGAKCMERAKTFFTCEIDKVEVMKKQMEESLANLTK